MEIGKPDRSCQESDSIMDLGEKADIRAWYEFLVEECELVIGDDWWWGWRNDRWHVQFRDPRIGTKVRLKIRNDS